MSKFSEKFQEGWDKAKIKAHEVKEKILEPKTAATIIFGVMAINKLAKPIVKTIREVREDERHRTVYDPQLGISVTTKRPLTNSESYEYSMRVKSGQTRVEALRDMRLLK